jgi:Peptidase propeptide and YPEB domain
MHRQRLSATQVASAPIVPFSTFRWMAHRRGTVFIALCRGCVPVPFTGDLEMNAMKILTASALLIASLGMPVFGESGEGNADPATTKEVTAMMVADGYDVRRVVVEGDKIEVYALKDGKQFVIYLDQALKVVKTVEG